MNWNPLLKMLVILVRYVGERMINIGEERVLRQQLELLNKKLEKANEARNKSIIDSNSGKLLQDDSHRRD